MKKETKRWWEDKLFDKFVADNIADCISIECWEEMGDELLSLIKEIEDKAEERGREEEVCNYCFEKKETITICEDCMNLVNNHS